MSSKQSVIDFIVKSFKRVAPKNNGIAKVKERLEAMSEKEFEQLMIRVKEEQDIIPMFEENVSNQDSNLEPWIDALEEMGVSTHEHVIFVDPETGEEAPSEKKHPIYYLPVRRQIQHQQDKISVGEDDTRIDVRTGQPSSESKGSTMTAPEVFLTDSKGLRASLVELMKVNGGDVDAYRKMKKTLTETGGYSLGPILEDDTQVRSTESLGAYLFAMHFDNNVAKNQDVE